MISSGRDTHTDVSLDLHGVACVCVKNKKAKLLRKKHQKSNHKARLSMLSATAE